MTQENLMPWRHSLVFKIVGTTVFVYFLVTLSLDRFGLPGDLRIAPQDNLLFYLQPRSI
mgnify:CR=1 FL=1